MAEKFPNFVKDINLQSQAEWIAKQDKPKEIHTMIHLCFKKT